MSDYMKQLELIQINQQITESKFILEDLSIRGYRHEDYEDILEEVKTLEDKKENIEKKQPLLARLAKKINDDAVKDTLAKKDKALSVNPVGLKVRVHVGTFKEPIAINKKFAGEIKTLLAKYEKDKDLGSFKSEFKRIHKNYKDIRVSTIEQKDKTLTEVKNISKQDIKNAVKFLENLESTSKVLNSNDEKIFNDHTKFIEKYDNSYVKGAAKLCYFADNASTRYEIFKLDNKLIDSNNIIKLAAKYNPRKLKESAELVELEEDVMLYENFFDDIE